MGAGVGRGWCARWKMCKRGCVSQCRDLDPAEMLLAGVVRLAIRDAQQTKNARLREDARRWLWWWSPAIAKRAELPRATTVAMLVTLKATEMP
jgi:hypothetical protein